MSRIKTKNSKSIIAFRHQEKEKHIKLYHMHMSLYITELFSKSVFFGENEKQSHAPKNKKKKTNLQTDQCSPKYLMTPT